MSVPRKPMPLHFGARCTNPAHIEPTRDECKVGGPHVFQAMDPRDADTWGRTGLRCVECGAAPKEERRG